MILNSIRHGHFRQALQLLLAGLLRGSSDLYVRHQQALGIAVLIVFAIGFMALAWVRPVYNWDFLAYLGSSAKSWFGSAAEIHAYAYAAVRDHAPADAFEALTRGDAYRLRQFTDPDAFVSMLGMYEVKWLYVTMLTWLVPLAGPLEASFLVNCLAMAILTVSLILWLRATGLIGYAPVAIMLLFLLQFQSFGLAQQPDFLANALVVAGLLSIDRSKLWAGALSLLLAVLIRPDQLATVGVLFFCAWFLRDRAWGFLAIAFLVTLLAWIATSRLSPGVGYWSHFWFSTYHMQDTMAGFDPSFSLKVYVVAVAYNLYRALFENTWLAAYGLLVAIFAYFYWRSSFSTLRRQVIVLTVLLSVPAKFVIFPLHDGRIYFAMLFVASLVALSEIVQAGSGAASSETRAGR